MISVFAGLCCAADAEYVVSPEELEGSEQDAFFRVTVLEEELRVMAPDLTAIQVRPACPTACCAAHAVPCCAAWGTP